VRSAALLSLLFTSAFAATLASPAIAACTETSPCVDAEPLWLSPSAGRLNFVSETAALPAGEAGVGATFGFRLRPAVLTVPAPNRDGRDVNVLSHATDLSLALRLGIGNRLELTLLLPAGLYQRGAGIKGVTTQKASEIDTTTLHDPRIGFGYSLNTRSPHFGAKLRFEAKLPLGNRAALSGEESAVASPSFAVSAKLGGFFGGAELGARLRRPTDLFGARIGSQGLLAAGAGYELGRPRISFSGELYLLPSLIPSGNLRYLPAEWLVSTRFAPRNVSTLSFGLGAGGGLPFSGDAAGSSLAFGVPSFRALFYTRFTPAAD
jgi:hypothetical protein